MGSGKRIIGWLLDEDERAALLTLVPPRYERVIAHHVTLHSGTTAPLPEPAVATIVGVADDGDGVQALVVAIGGTTDRPGGGTYHITWSLGGERIARESNAVILAHGWTGLAALPPVTLIPAIL